ncbi:hypothetical protein [Acutalibacter muris]|uniref:hypothetical protein n=1 Tax=Acutalibacter muris TaxID=1796620 RepID=UPI00272A5AAB|nr:hypothetical protein [Acutalibacter muris]
MAMVENWPSTVSMRWLVCSILTVEKDNSTVTIIISKKKINAFPGFRIICFMLVIIYPSKRMYTKQVHVEWTCYSMQ